MGMPRQTGHSSSASSSDLSSSGRLHSSSFFLYNTKHLLCQCLDFTFYTDKKENQIFLIYREIQNGAVAKSYYDSYMTNGLLIYEEIFAHFLIYDFATAPLWISFYMRKTLFSFLSVYKMKQSFVVLILCWFFSYWIVLMTLYSELFLSRSSISCLTSSTFSWWEAVTCSQE